ncbi:BA14K family protein [Mesorhizobium sp. M1C.F.Ca.ET.193.01.1.1]|uniref:BA14K family protein n=1 Tax=unclassified Mesorhizobium TaxID=325217 RepID=UPI000FD2001F|nr:MULTISPECIES: BA14K family protein [unclassified Mesorhizobium]TGS91963.1 BA14K family protein [bacterium M00.F.Ca.ET.177.01.1.1]TGQ50053.1 BA14K family protein [Mesorhizobium sp. M1C.F.Ca.ET.210.01.1.1]TGQ64747.1 BA14K family protein [Mesorhizobium sp. M1C.F.Ca.ET.212.01.1.1]TGQ98363.1 BA14K family protein [Mesorhizobium sp. M1C.F.Ca.ET.204.01.1.1]TGR18668.1 BA14K family protein [Mesorhizobium sp. M1C.F.Ca.ET.196.01.1.1]
MKALLGIVGGFVLTLAVFASGLAFAVWLLAAKPVRQATPAIGVSELWTKDAQPVDPAKQELERIPAQQAAGAPAKADETAKADSGTQTALATPQPATPRQLQPLPGLPQPGQPMPDANVAQPSEQAAQNAPAEQAQLPAAHLEWCANRYRSYRPNENSYRSYSGELRPCVSPYFDPGSTASTEARQNGQAEDQAGTSDQAEVTDDQAETEGYATTRDGYATTYGGPPEEITPEQEQAWSGRQLSGDHIDYCFSRYRSYNPQDNTYQPYDGGPRRQCD